MILEFTVLGSKDLGLNGQNNILYVLANREQNMSSLCVRQYSKVYVSSFKFELTAKRGVRICQARSIENQTRSIENHNNNNNNNKKKKKKKKILQIFKSGLSPRKRLGFQFNLSTYKRETLATFFRLLGRHMRYSVKSKRFCTF